MSTDHQPSRRLPKFDLIDLELFTRVVEAGSITHGAARTHLALPSASARIKFMERAVGGPLLIRGRRGVTTTPAGELLHRHARVVLSDMDRLVGDLARYGEGLVATVRVLANTAAVAATLPTDLMVFLREHPHIDVDLEELQSHAIVEAVAAGRAEIGIIADTVNAGRLRCVPLREDHLVLVVPRDHAFVKRSHMHFHDALAEPFVGLSKGSALQEHLSGQALPLGEKPMYRVRYPSVEHVCEAISHGIGVGVLPEAVAERWQASYPIATVPLEDAWAHRRLLLCTDPSRELSAPALALLAHLEKVMLGSAGNSSRRAHADPSAGEPA